MTSASSSRDKPLRFMDFPPEIRNEVYANLLCSFEEPVEKPEANEEHECMIDIDQLGRLAHTAILLANRQVYQEAKDVMLRQNQFVRIFTRDVRLLTFPRRVILHTNFPAQDPIVRNFKGAVMSYSVESLNRVQMGSCYCCHSAAPHDFVILARDLDEFLRAFAGPENDLPALPIGAEHQISLHDPFEISTDTNYNPVKVQRSLLQPFQNHFHGFTHFKIKGKVDKKLAKAVLKEIKKESLPDPYLFLEEVTQLKNKGTGSFREGKAIDAVRIWRCGIFKLRRLQNSKLWSKMKGEFNVDIFDSLAQLYFTLYSNTAQYYLGDMHIQSADEEYEMLFDGAALVTYNVLCAIRAGDVFETAWHPSARQEAKVIFRLAQAARLAGDLFSASCLIEDALNLQPNDTSLLREATEIRRRV